MNSSCDSPTQKVAFPEGERIFPRYLGSEEGTYHPLRSLVAEIPSEEYGQTGLVANAGLVTVSKTVAYHLALPLTS